MSFRASISSYVSFSEVSISSCTYTKRPISILLPTKTSILYRAKIFACSPSFFKWSASSVPLNEVRVKLLVKLSCS